MPNSALRDLLDSQRTWGDLDVTKSHGVTRHRLVVYPPGVDRDQRIALRLWRAYSVWGLGLWVLVQVTLMAVISPWGAVVAATLTCLAIGAVLRARARRVHGDVRTLTAVRTVHSPDARARQDEFVSLAERLIRADAAFAAREITRVEHEAEVWRVYDRLAATR